MKKIFLLPLLLLSALGLSAQTSKTGALLWKISGNGLASPSYILGTLHFKPASFFDSIPGAKSAFEHCGQAVGEITMGDMGALQGKLQGAMMMPSDTTYKMLYTEEQYKFVSDKIAGVLGGTLDQMGMLKPAGIDMILTIVFAGKHFPQLADGNLLDTSIQANAAAAGKPVLGLESVEDQLHALLYAHSLKRQAEVLMYSLEHMDEIPAKMDALVSDYNKGDLDALYKMSVSDTPYTPAEQNIVNKDRNDRWMAKLPAIMKDKPSFIAVGALHLAGPGGLLAQLEKAGYKVEKVK